MNPNLIIDALGGTYKTAKLCDVKPGAVSQWRRNGIPKARLMFLKVVKPEVFAKLEADEALRQQTGQNED